MKYLEKIALQPSALRLPEAFSRLFQQWSRIYFILDCTGISKGGVSGKRAGAEAELSSMTGLQFHFPGTWENVSFQAQKCWKGIVWGIKPPGVLQLSFLPEAAPLPPPQGECWICNIDHLGHQASFVKPGSSRNPSGFIRTCSFSLCCCPADFSSVLIPAPSIC